MMNLYEHAGDLFIVPAQICSVAKMEGDDDRGNTIYGLELIMISGKQIRVICDDEEDQLGSFNHLKQLIADAHGLGPRH